MNPGLLGRSSEDGERRRRFGSLPRGAQQILQRLVRLTSRSATTFHTCGMKACAEAPIPLRQEWADDTRGRPLCRLRARLAH